MPPQTAMKMRRRSRFFRRLQRIRKNRMQPRKIMRNQRKNLQRIRRRKKTRHRPSGSDITASATENRCWSRKNRRSGQPPYSADKPGIMSQRQNWKPSMAHLALNARHIAGNCSSRIRITETPANSGQTVRLFTTKKTANGGFR